MQVTHSITRLDKSNVRMTITVPRNEVRSQYYKLLKEYSKQIQLPGFRRGKAPQEVVERKLGEKLRDEARAKIIQNAIDEVFDDEKMAREDRPLPYSPPRIDEMPILNLERDLQFMLIYDVLPTISVGQWKGLEVEVPDAAVTDEDVARELEELRERNAVVLDRDENAPARLGDVAAISYTGLDKDGAELPEARRDDFVFTLGSKHNIYLIDDDIVGMKKGETRELTKTYGDGEDVGPLAGKTVYLRVTLTSLKEKKLPDLDDDLAQDVDEQFKTLDDLKASIQERLEKSLAARLRELKLNKILEKIMESSPVIFPDSMVQAEVQERLNGLARRFDTDVRGVLNMMAETGNDLGVIEKNWRETAVKSLHARFIVETLVKEQRIEASDADVEQELAQAAAETGRPLEEVKQQYAEGKLMDYIRESIRERRLFDLLLAENKINLGSRANFVDVMGNNG